MESIFSLRVRKREQGKMDFGNTYLTLVMGENKEKERKKKGSKPSADLFFSSSGLCPGLAALPTG